MAGLAALLRPPLGEAPRADLTSLLRKRSSLGHLLKDQPRDELGRFSSAGDETGSSAPQPGEKFVVYRLGHADERNLDDKNAGNAEGVADHVQRTQDYDRPQPVQGTGDTIHAYEVQSLHTFGGFDRFNSGQGDSQLTTPGRKVEVRRPDTAAATPSNHEFVSYSFPKGSISARHLGSVSVSDLQNSRLGGKDFDQTGSLAGARAIREHFARVNIGKLLKYSDDQPRDERGRWGDGSHDAEVKALFADNHGIERGDMPQIPNGAMKDKFLAELADKGVGHTHEAVMAHELKATQSTYQIENVNYLAGQAGGKYTGNPILVSREGRVLDGHHRWAGAAIEKQPIDVIRVDAPIHELVAAARDFSARNAIPARKFWASLTLVKEYNPDQPRDERGRWGSGGAAHEVKTQAVHGSGGPVPAVAASAFLPPRMMATIARESAKAMPEERRTLTPEQHARASAELASRVAAAHDAKPGYDRVMNELGQQLGANVMLAGIKGGDRLLEKHVFENATAEHPHGDPSKMQDLVRGSLIVNAPRDIAAAVQAIRDRFEVIREKDRFANPIPGSHYKDVLMNVRLPNGAIGEIQVHIPEMISAKAVGHKLYEISRALPDGSSRKSTLVNLQNKIYERAARHNTRRTGS